MTTTLIVLALALAVAWFCLRQRSARESARYAAADARDRRKTTSKSKYHAVTIRYAAKACSAAKDLEGHRFLATAAPRLPLPGCDLDHCECRFQHYDDRRSGRDRRSPFASGGTATATGKFELERRQSEERRAKG